MNPLFLGQLVDLVGKISDKVWPDPAKKIEAQTALLQMQQSGELAILEKLGQSDSAQVEINKIEAASDSKFKSYWRPALGWICVSGFAYQLLARPFLIGFGAGDFPALDMETLSALTFGMLGLAGFRTVEKLKR
jgi:hypothetical protein